MQFALRLCLHSSDCFTPPPLPPTHTLYSLCRVPPWQLQFHDWQLHTVRLMAHVTLWWQARSLPGQWQASVDLMSFICRHILHLMFACITRTC